MRRQLIAAAAAAAALVSVLPAHAATSAPKPQITDPAGDANGINDQGGLLPLPTASTPVDVSSADILSVLFQTTFVTKKVKHKTVKVPTGMTATMTLAAAPTTPFVNYRVSVSTAGCTSLFFEYSTSPGRTPTQLRCPGSIPILSADTQYAVTSVVKDNTITWTVPLKSLPVGTVLSSLEADTRFNPDKATAPAFDTATSSATFTVGK